jgi:hypothetical protein
MVTWYNSLRNSDFKGIDVRRLNVQILIKFLMADKQEFIFRLHDMWNLLLLQVGDGALSPLLVDFHVREAFFGTSKHYFSEVFWNFDIQLMNFYLFIVNNLAIEGLVLISIHVVHYYFLLVTHFHCYVAS